MGDLFRYIISNQQRTDCNRSLALANHTTLYATKKEKPLKVSLSVLEAGIEPARTLLSTGF